jgi:hypothetical protein
MKPKYHIRNSFLSSSHQVDLLLAPGFVALSTNTFSRFNVAVLTASCEPKIHIGRLMGHVDYWLMQVGIGVDLAVFF